MPASKKYSSKFGITWPIIGLAVTPNDPCLLINGSFLDYPFGDLFYIGSSPITLCVS